MVSSIHMLMSVAMLWLTLARRVHLRGSQHNMRTIDLFNIQKQSEERRKQEKIITKSVFNGRRTFSDGDIRNSTFEMENSGDVVYENNTIDDSLEHNNTFSPNVTRQTCPRCFPRESVVQMRISWLKSYILEKLNLEKPPNVTGQTIPDENVLRKIMHNFDRHGRRYKMARRMDKKEVDEGEEENIVVVRSQRVPAEIPLQKVLNRNSANIFTLPRDVTSSNIKSASILFYIRPPKKREDIKNIVLYIYRLTSDGSNSQSQFIYRIWESHTFKLHSNEKKRLRRGHSIWKTLHITRFARHMLTDDRVVGYEVVAALRRSTDTDDDNKEEMDIISGFSDDPTTDKFTPFLEIHVTSHPARRKRSADEMMCHEDDDEVNCCRYPLNIEFKDFNWDFIIVPDRYEANYCHGECPMYSNHRSHSYLARQFKQEATPCCTPLKFRSQMLLHFNDKNEIRLTEVQNLVALSCGCA